MKQDQVFEEKIVVSGGWGNNGRLNTVESYDHIADEWTHMPSMTKPAAYHCLVALKHKLFAIRERNQFEVYDSTCKNFVSIESSYWYFEQAISLGNKIVIFFRESSAVFCYDIDEEKWSKGSCCATSDKTNYFTKIPKLSL